ncbi:MAG: GNAT family N-acetyltransferase [Sphingobacteriales bacterium]|nr:MAG: GNAT family N-acetyltransferase [Sphingobacteriales bacterium]
MPLNNSNITIGRAVKEDCPRMMELVLELAIFEREPDAVTVTLEHFENSGFGENPVWWAFVAEVDGVVQGFALYYIRYSTWKGQKMYLEDIIITEAYRNRGLGSRLMDALIKEAADKNLHGLTWQVLNWNEPAIKFYERYKARFDNEWVNVMLDF